MRVAFAKLEEMLSELKEKIIHEVRVEALFDQKNQQRIPFWRLYVSVEALLDRETNLCGCYESVTYRGFKPMEPREAQSLFHKNEEEMERMREKLSEEGFTVRSGHFVE